MQEKLNKLVSDCIELGRYKAALDGVGFAGHDISLSEGETLGSKILSLEEQINNTISELTLSSLFTD